MQDLENIFMATGSNCQTVLITNEGAGQRTGDRAPEDRAPEDRTPEVRTDKQMNVQHRTLNIEI
jgi:hypothetical protein